MLIGGCCHAPDGRPASVAGAARAEFPAALLGLGSLVQLALSAWVLLAVVLAWSRAPPPSSAPSRLASCAARCSRARPARWRSRRCTPTGAPPTGLRLPARLPDRGAAPRAPQVPPPWSYARGDTLWAIAARSLPAGATNAQIARACSQWHAANRDVIGDDPNLIFPTNVSLRRSGRIPHEDRNSPARPLAPHVRRPRRTRTRPDPAAVPRPESSAAGPCRAWPDDATDAPTRRAVHAGARRGPLGRAGGPADGSVDGTRRLRPADEPAEAHARVPPRRDPATVRASCRSTWRWSTTAQPRSPVAWCIAAARARSPYAWSCRPPTAASAAGAAPPWVWA